ncbi:putative Homeobox-3 [Tripterygium wilfordii]|uniref:Putative Homeobox-3 n=1 Tax=Tripterygium wilfordii TaxID=458696 RepID=A0A7J7C3I9_TRIWF|nr:WUSCHEL-related homeobox 9 [Tripterygium wilfordii]KAF5728710.1 putative Homeobox-3 [Tripterygium wilfordii]
MASSNRHWPSMFKTKPHHHHHQWQHDINSNSLISTTACHRTTPYSSSGCDQERSPEPKPRWNPKPEQIRILEAIFNSGMVNPPRDEIRKIRAQLQEFGQVGDANVFYWFQNRKSRSKHKLRHLQNSSKQPPQQQITNHTPPPSASSSSSSSEKSSPNERSLSLKSPSTNHHVISNNSPTGSGSVNQTNYFQTQSDHQFASEVPYFFPVHQQGTGFLFSELSNVVHHDQTVLGPCTSLLLSEMMSSSSTNGDTKKDHEEYKTMKLQPQQLSYSTATSVDPSINTVVPPTSSVTTTVGLTVPSTIINQIQGVSESGGVLAARHTVFINDVAFEVNSGPFNVKEAFGDDVMLIHSSGQPVLTNEWGLTLQSLQHGGSYYLVTFS